MPPCCSLHGSFPVSSAAEGSPREGGSATSSVEDGRPPKRAQDVQGSAAARRRALPIVPVPVAARRHGRFRLLPTPVVVASGIVAPVAPGRPVAGDLVHIDHAGVVHGGRHPRRRRRGLSRWPIAPV